MTMNLFRCTPDRSLDREYLRICAVYKLLKVQRIGRQRAIDLLAEKKVEKPCRLVELWAANPLKNIDMAP